jgi:serine/threonine protein kinase
VQEACVVIITELAAGGELFDTLASMGNFSEPCARVIMAQALDAVAHIHSRKIVHRDLKPENMLLFDLLQQQQQQVQAAVDATVAVSATPTHHSRLVACCGVVSVVVLWLFLLPLSPVVAC